MRYQPGKRSSLGWRPPFTIFNREEFERVLSLHGTKRAYFSRDERRMKFPREVSGSGIFVETNLNAKLIADICSDLLRLFGYSAEDLNIERSPVSFST